MKIAKALKTLHSFLFSTREQRVDCILFALLLSALWVARPSVNVWLTEVIGGMLSGVAMFLESYPWLKYCLGILIVLLTVLFVLRHVSDRYRSRQSLMAVLLAANVLVAGASYWDYLTLIGPFTFLHLLLICLVAIFVSVCVYVRRESHNEEPKLSGRFFTDDAINLKGVDNASSANAIDSNRLGYADYLVDRILGTNLGQESFSVGVSGEWGTGKTTFLNAVAAALERYSSGRVASIVWFKTWNSSSPSQIVTDFFNVLVEKISPDYSVVRKPMLKYAELLKAMDAKKPFVFLADIYDQHRTKSFETVKKQISTYLRNYEKIIPVLIDDMDRLSGDEIAEVLRLIRNTADFPNVVYITAYDKGYLEAQLQKKGIPNPSVYIEKFFSVEFALPKLEDCYQYDVFAREVKKMSTSQELLRYVDRMPGSTQSLLCSAFHNFRQVKRFARVFVNDAEYFASKYNLGQHISMNDFLLLKLLYYTDSSLYNILERQQYDLMVRSKNLWKGFYPLKLRPRVFDAEEKEDPLIPAYEGATVTGLSKSILQSLLVLNDSKNARSLVNYEVYPLYFALDIDERHISVQALKKLVYGEEDLNAAFQEWSKQNKLNSLYHHLLSFRQAAMDEHAAERYLTLVIKLIPHLNTCKAIVDRTMIVAQYPEPLRDSLSRFVMTEFVTMIESLSLEDMMDSAHESVASALVYIYELEMTEEQDNGNEGKTLIGTTANAKQLLENNFINFVSDTLPNTDELFRDNSLLQSLVKANVLLVDTDDGLMVGPNLIADAIVDYFKDHKGKNKQRAVDMFSLPSAFPVEYEEYKLEELQDKKDSMFGCGDLYDKLIANCF